MTVVASIATLAYPAGIQMPRRLQCEVKDTGCQHGEQQPAVATILPGVVTRTPRDHDSDSEEDSSDQELIQQRRHFHIADTYVHFTAEVRSETMQSPTSLGTISLGDR